jgi:type I restriction enzyme R subunit
VKLELDSSARETIDDEVEELTEDEEESARARTKSRWAALEKLVGADSRMKTVAADLVKHFETRQDTMQGKAMTVCMSREVCVKLYDQIIELKPEWHDPDPEKGAIKVVMTGSASDRETLRPHVYSGKVKKRLEKRFKDATDPLKIVIVRDMWLTGFDVPCLTTMYVDKPMKDHNLMQAIARVNRVFKDKPGGLVVDYIGIANGVHAEQGAGASDRTGRRDAAEAARRDGGRLGDAARSGLQRLPGERAEADAGGGGPYSWPGRW